LRNLAVASLWLRPRAWVSPGEAQSLIEKRTVQGAYFFEKRKEHGPWKPLVYPHIVLAACCTFYMFYLASTLRLAAEIQRLDIGQAGDPTTQVGIRS
jgi:hypothetical protein